MYFAENRFTSEAIDQLIVLYKNTVNVRIIMESKFLYCLTSYNREVEKVKRTIDQ